MGLFDLFKKKQEQEEKKQPEVVIAELEAAEDIGEIAKILAENKIISTPKDKYHNVFGQDITHLDEDGELPWGWISANKEFTERINTEYKYFLDAWYDIRNKDVIKERWALKSLVIYLEDAKKLCISKGECFVKWFDDLIASQERIDEYKTRQNYIEDNIDALLEAEKLKKEEEKRRREIEENIMPKVKEALIEIMENEPNIMQSELCKRFDPELKSYISSELYYMEKSGLIGREKSGRSYKLYVK